MTSMARSAGHGFFSRKAVMNVLGITAEYNPFHRGHAYHIEEARKASGADYTVVVMSGNFTQRGEPAIADKWNRSRDAVSGGADLVFELPFLFACNRAQAFAAGGVDTLLAAGATHISFGCEAGDPDRLQELAGALRSREEALAQATRDIMTEGLSYAKAYETAVREALGEEAAEIILTPNNILAVEYLKRIAFWQERGREVMAVPIRRYGSGYHEADGMAGFAGASQIRKMLRDGITEEELKKFLPLETAGWLAADGAAARFASESREASGNLFQLLKGILLRSTPEELASIYCIGEGIENRLKNEINTASDLDSLIISMVSKRYTAAAVQRMLLYVALGLKGSTTDPLIAEVEGGSLAPYLRLLAAGRSGRKLLRQMESNVITNVNKQMPEDTWSAEMLAIDMQAADLYNALHGKRLYDYSDKVMQPYIES